MLKQKDKAQLMWKTMNKFFFLIKLGKKKIQSS